MAGSEKDCISRRRDLVVSRFEGASAENTLRVAANGQSAVVGAHPLTGPWARSPTLSIAAPPPSRLVRPRKILCRHAWSQFVRPTDRGHEAVRETGWVSSEGYQDLQRPDRLGVLRPQSITVGACIEMTEQAAPLDPVEPAYRGDRDVIYELSTLRRQHCQLGMVTEARPLAPRQWIEQCFVPLYRERCVPHPLVAQIRPLG